MSVIMTILRLTTSLVCAAATVLPGVSEAQSTPHIPEPMVFDMVRPLGAQRGELEINTLAQRNLSGSGSRTEWAPEIEYAFMDGLAIEFELPFENSELTEYKMGLQGTFGAFADGKGVHGVQYLGVHNRAQDQWENTLVYLLGYRFDDRWSVMNMVGVGDIVVDRPDHSHLIVNHSTFYDLTSATVIGVEVNLRRSGVEETLIMPQIQQALDDGWMVQGGLGAQRVEDDRWRPRLGLRVIKQF